MKPRASKRPTVLELARNFDALADDQVVSPQVTYAVVNTSEWTARRHPLPFRRIYITPHRYGHRVGDIRAYVRGKSP